jgi:hypothetical protein
MGGFGSGRREYATTPVVEECRSMDTDELKELTEHPNATGNIYWGDPDDDDANYLTWRTEGVREFDGEERADRVRFRYTTTHYPSEESTTVDYVVRFDYTEPNFGGVRPWFICPECDTRRRKLYLPPRRNADRYLCRECYDLGYRSSRTSGNELERAEQRYRKAFAKADAEDRRPHPNNLPYTPDRPKGMHRDTFADLVEGVREAKQEWREEMDGRMRDLLADMGAGAEHAAGAFGYTDR